VRLLNSSAQQMLVADKSRASKGGIPSNYSEGGGQWGERLYGQCGLRWLGRTGIASHCVCGLSS
jgi:hypothetical protein